MSSMAIAFAALLTVADADFGWPDTIAVAAREAADLPDPQRLRAIERLTAAGIRVGVGMAPILPDQRIVGDPLQPTQFPEEPN